VARSQPLTARELEEIDLLERIHGRTPLREFLARLVPHEPLLPHLDPLISLIERARREQIKACVSYPPRHGKTETVKRSMAWWLSETPADRCAYVAKSSEFAEDQSESIRRYAERAGVRMGSVQRRAHWSTAMGGGLFATGADKGLVGYGVSGLLVVDDPYSGREAAESPAQRGKIWDAFVSDTLTRLEGASVIVVHTRWVKDDLIGRLTDEFAEYGWDYLNIPAIAEEDDRFGRKPGEALWPDRYPVEYFNRHVRPYGEYDFAALYQGRPRPRGARVFGDPHYYTPGSVNLNGCRYFIAADPAASVITTADYSSAVVIAARGTGADMVCYVLDVYRAQVEVPQFVDDLIALQARYGHAPVGIESAGVGKPLPAMLRRINPDLMVRPLPAQGDKFQRAQPVASAWNTGRVLVPNDSPPWLAAFLKEVVDFTGVSDPHDDQVDALAYAFNMAHAGGATYKRHDKPVLRLRR
jgi:predicted phage terminase large subunit-like protein